MSEKEKSVSEKLVEIQSTLKVPKSLWNDFSKFKYRSAEGILKAVRPILKKHKLYLCLTDEVVNIGQFNYVKSTAILSDGIDEEKTSAYAREPITKKGMDDSQISGAASSYARKYALCGLFAIDDGTDNDSTVPDDYLEIVEKIEEAEDVETIEKIYKIAPSKYRNKIVSICSERKKQILGES